MRRAGRLVSSRDLLQAVWGPQYGDETNYLRVHMAHIRRKLEPEPSRPRYFHTEPGMGYRFEPPEPPELPAPRHRTRTAKKPLTSARQRVETRQCGRADLVGYLWPH